MRALPPSALAAIAALGLAAAAAAQTAADWWAYRPLQRPAVPEVGDDPFVRNDVDRFVLAKLRAAGLSPSPPADKPTLIRRLSFDLLGLPPTPEEVEAFVADTGDDAFERLVDRLLASPQYGIKWGRHWLDLVRWAETNSFERDGRKPAAWRYRDWVVDALNRDVPWSEFLQLQLAGDERPDADAASIVATGYCRLGLWDDEPTDPLQSIYDDFDGIADTTARAMLGISIGCARCHDHKKDPITARDYYSFLAFFENLRPYRPLRGLGEQLAPGNFTTQVSERGAAAEWQQQRAAWQQARDEGRQRAVAAADAAWTRASATARVRALAGQQGLLLGSYGCERLEPTRLCDDIGDRHGAIEGQVVAVPGYRGQALRFDGDDNVVLPRLVEDSFTIALRVRSAQGGRGRRDDTRWFTGDGLVDGEVPGIERDFGLAWHSDGRVVAGVGAPETFVSSPPGYADGQWHHVAFTRDRSSGRIALYVDGVLADHATGNQERLDAPPRLVVGGLQPGGHGFRGDLDELCFYGRALTAAEVQALAFDLRGGLAAAASSGAELTALAAMSPPQLATFTVLCAREKGPTGPDGFVRVRGDVHSQGDPVSPAFPAVLGAAPPVVTPTADGASSGRRTALASWITSPDNPLTWRVLANRLFQHHFGRGLCRTPNDFGRLGELPTHPELLDWLACEVLARGQSLKAMHRLLVTSGTWRMTCAVASEVHAAKDPQNDLLWRFDRRRLQAEEVRDTMLAMTGTLDLRVGGESVYPPLPEAVLATASRPDEAWGNSSPEDSARRSIYVHLKRSLLEPVLAAFDVADTDGSCPQRFATVQPTQALLLLNGDFAHGCARTFAARLHGEASDLRARLQRGVWLATGRAPTAAEVDRLAALCSDLQQGHGRGEAEALQRCCLLLLNSNEFLYLD